MRTPEQLEELRWQRQHVRFLGGPLKLHRLPLWPGKWCVYVPAQFSSGLMTAAPSWYRFEGFAQACAFIRVMMAPINDYTFLVWGRDAIQFQSAEARAALGPLFSDIKIEGEGDDRVAL